MLRSWHHPLSQCSVGRPTEWGHLLRNCVILTELDVQQVEHDKTAEHLWPLDFISAEEGDIGCIPPLSGKGLALASSLCFCLEVKCNRKCQKVEVLSSWWPRFFSDWQNLEIYSPFRKDEANGISCYLVKLMKSNLFFSS